MTTELNQQDTTGLATAAAAVIAAAASGLSDGVGIPVKLEPTAIAVDNAPPPGVEDVWVELPLAGAVSGITHLVLDGADAGAIVAAVKPDHGQDAPLDEEALTALAAAMAHFSTGVAAAMSAGLGEPVAAGTPGASLQRPEDLVGGTAAITCAGTIADADDVEVFWLVDAPMAALLRDSWGTASAEPPAAEPPPVPTAAPAPSPAVAVPAAGGGVIDSVELDIAVELGNVAMTIGELLHMGEGSVVTLTQSVGDKVVMLANGTAVASGEVVVVDGTLGFRVAELITEAPGG